MIKKQCIHTTAKKAQSLLQETNNQAQHFKWKDWK